MVSSIEQGFGVTLTEYFSQYPGKVVCAVVQPAIDIVNFMFSLYLPTRLQRKQLSKHRKLII